MNRDVIIACDFATKKDLDKFLVDFEGLNPYLKIGMEMFYGEGPQLVRDLKKRGFRIFLDLKLHDIPNTVKKAMKNVAKLGVDIVNVHASGTVKMMEFAIDGLEEGTPSGQTRPLCIAVTQLTSTSEEIMKNELLISATLPETVKKYALNAKTAGLDGVVCSPLEAPVIAEACGDEFVSVTPGIRFSTDSVGDQVRVTTPSDAKKLGSHFIVVGRSITGASNPVEAYKKCLQEFC